MHSRCKHWKFVLHNWGAFDSCSTWRMKRNFANTSRTFYIYIHWKVYVSMRNFFALDCAFHELIHAWCYEKIMYKVIWNVRHLWSNEMSDTLLKDWNSARNCKFSTEIIFLLNNLKKAVHIMNASLLCANWTFIMHKKLLT